MSDREAMTPGSPLGSNSPLRRTDPAPDLPALEVVLSRGDRRRMRRRAGQAGLAATAMLLVVAVVVALQSPELPPVTTTTVEPTPTQQASNEPTRTPTPTPTSTATPTSTSTATSTPTAPRSATTTAPGPSSAPTLPRVGRPSPSARSSAAPAGAPSAAPSVRDVDCGVLRAGSPPQTFDRVKIEQGSITCEEALRVAATFIRSDSDRLSVEGWICGSYEGFAFGCSPDTSTSENDMVVAESREEDYDKVVRECAVRLAARSEQVELEVTGPTSCTEATRIANAFASSGRETLTLDGWRCAAQRGEQDPFLCTKSRATGAALEIRYA